MWQHFLALPLVARIVAWAVLGLLALWAIIKAKVIHAALKKVTDAASEYFWAWFRKKVATGESPDTYERTYKGILEGVWYTSTPRTMELFRVNSNGVKITVQVVDATVLYRLMRGTLVEIDTEVMPGYQAELVKRVRRNGSRLKERFPTETEQYYEWSQKDPMGHWEAHKKDKKS
jgi:hypothetical protein